GVVGLAASTYDVGSISSDDLTRVIPIAIGVIALLLALVMRSLVAPLYLLALGEDYNILVMARIREEARNLPLRRAVSRSLHMTGTTVTSAGIVLTGTFGILALVGGGGSGNTVLDVGAGLAMGIAMDTFLVRTLLVPATVVLLGRWNWWPSKLGTSPGPAVPPQA